MGKEIKDMVKKSYGQIAVKGGSCCGGESASCCGSGSTVDISRIKGYSEKELRSLPEGADLGLGCGNPVALASLKEGETVLDLGSGAGVDCFLAAERVGKSGRVIGVDMTTEMVERARKNADKGDYANVEFRLGEIESLPVLDGTIDVVISNCVINLVPDKYKAFKEVFRVLKPGGRMMVSDIVLTRELPDAVKNSASAYAGCVAGAMLKGDYLHAIEKAGFGGVSIEGEKTFPLDCIANDPFVKTLTDELKMPADELKGLAGSVLSIQVSAIKPA